MKPFIPLFQEQLPGEIYLTDESLITDRIASFDEQQLFDLDICQEIEICDIVTQESKEGETNGRSIEEETDDTLHTSTYSEEDSEYVDVTRQSQRRRKNPELWKQSVQKRKRNNREEYETSRRKKFPRHELKTPSCKCKNKCGDKVMKDHQMLMFQTYWKLDYECQRKFIMNHVTKKLKNRSTTGKESRRKHTYDYFLDGKTSKENTKVCKNFFLQTLNIGEKMVMYNINRNQGNCKDNRGRQKGWSTIPKADKDYIRNHIRSFPTLDSHYCRKKSQQKYLERDLSITKMYEIYKVECVQTQSENHRNCGFMIKFLKKNLI